MVRHAGALHQKRIDETNLIEQCINRLTQRAVGRTNQTSAFMRRRQHADGIALAVDKTGNLELEAGFQARIRRQNEQPGTAGGCGSRIQSSGVPARFAENRCSHRIGYRQGRVGGCTIGYDHFTDEAVNRGWH